MVGYQSFQDGRSLSFRDEVRSVCVDGSLSACYRHLWMAPDDGRAYNGRTVNKVYVLNSFSKHLFFFILLILILCINY